MTAKLDKIAHVMPSAAPTEEELRIWDSLPRDEQLRRLRDVLNHPDCATETSETMSDILAEARARAIASRG